MENKSFITEEELDKLYQNMNQPNIDYQYETVGEIEYETIGEYEFENVENEPIIGSINKIPNSYSIEVYLSSKGRFNGFNKVELSSYTAGDLEYLLTITKDPYRILEIICNILNTKVVSPKEFNFYNIHLNDLIEILAYMKYHFTNSKFVNLEENCNYCNSKIKVKLSLENLNFISIDKSDFIMKSQMEQYLQNLDNDLFKKLYNVEKNDENINQLLKNVIIENPIKIYHNNNIYYFNIPLVSDLVFSFKYVESKYIHKEKALINQYKDKKELELKLKELQNYKNLDILQTIRVNSLIKINDQLLNKFDLKLQKFKDLPLEVYETFLSFLNQIQFGLAGNLKYQCPNCNSIIRRDLSNRLDFFNLLPIDSITANRVPLHIRNTTFIFH